MGIFGKLKGAVSGSANKFAGRTDFLEAVAASAAYIASADGDVSEAEMEETLKVVMSLPEITAGFNDRQISDAVSAMFKRAEGGMVGRMKLLNELDDIKKDTNAGDMSEVILVTAIQIACADGEIGDKEKTAMEKVAVRLNLKLDKYI